MDFVKKKEIKSNDKNSTVVNATVGDIQPPEKPIELTKEQEFLIEEIKEYSKNYSFFYGLGDVAQLPETSLKAEQMNLLFAIYCELKKLRELVEKQQ